MYKRDSNRKAPHNAYTTGEGIVAGIAYKGYETQLLQIIPDIINL